MKLYFSPGACSLSPHIVLHELGLPHDGVKVDLKTKQTSDGRDFRTINPKGYVPTLQLDDGTILTEGPAIVQYLADQAPHKNLAPAHGTLGRYRLQEWLTFIGTEIHKTFSPLFVPGTPEDYKPQVKQRLLARLQWVDSELAGKPYLMGEQFSVADAYLFTVTNWGQYVGLDISQLKNLVAYRERIAARPAVQAAMKAEGLLK